MVRCVYVFVIGDFFPSQTRRYGFILLGTMVDISTRGDSAYSDEVVFLIVHNLFLGILGDSALRAKGYRFKAKPVYRFLFGGTASYRRVMVADVCILPLRN